MAKRLKRKVKYKEFIFKTRRNPKTKKTTYFAVSDAPSGIKSWRKVDKDLFGKPYIEFINDKKRDLRIEIFPMAVFSDDKNTPKYKAGYRYQVSIRPSIKRWFKTKKQALAYARAYMRKH